MCASVVEPEWAEPFTRTVGPSIGPREGYRKIWDCARPSRGCMGAGRARAPYIASGAASTRLYRELTRRRVRGDPHRNDTEAQRHRWRDISAWRPR